jgi:hypothetical protein
MIEVLINKILKHYAENLKEYSELRQLIGQFAIDNDSVLDIQSQQLISFNQEYDKRIQEIKKQEAALDILKSELCRVLKISHFSIDEMKNNPIFEFQSDSINRIGSLMLSRNNVIREILNLNDSLQRNLNMELEATKVSLNRIIQSNKLRNLYYVGTNSEAKYIDKNK